MENGVQHPIGINHGVGYQQVQEKKDISIGRQSLKLTNNTDHTAQNSLHSIGSTNRTTVSHVQGNSNKIPFPSDQEKQVNEQFHAFVSKLTSKIRQAVQDIKTGAATFISISAAALKGDLRPAQEYLTAKNGDLAGIIRENRVMQFSHDMEAKVMKGKFVRNQKATLEAVAEKTKLSIGKNGILTGRIKTTLGDAVQVPLKVVEKMPGTLEALGLELKEAVIEDGVGIGKEFVGHASDLGSAMKAALPNSEVLRDSALEIKKTVSKPFQALSTLIIDKDQNQSGVSNNENILTIGDFFRPANTQKYEDCRLVFIPSKNEFQILEKSKKPPAGSITDPAQVKEQVVIAIKNTASEFAFHGKIAAAQNFAPIGGGREFGLSTVPQWMEGSYKLDNNQNVEVLASVAAGQNMGIARDNAKVFEENKGLLNTLWTISKMPDDWQIEAASDTIGASLPAIELFGIRQSDNFLGALSNKAVAETEKNLENLAATAEKLREGKLTEAERKLEKLEKKFEDGRITEVKYKNLKGKAESAVNKWKSPDANSLVELVFAPTAISQAFNQSAVEGMRKMFDKYCDNNIGKSYQPAAKWLSEESPGFAIYANWNAELGSKLDKLDLNGYIQDRKEINALFESAGSNTSKLPELMKKIEEFIQKYPPEVMEKKQAALKQIQGEMGNPLPLYVKTSHPDYPGLILPDSVFTTEGDWREPTANELADAKSWERWNQK